MYGEYFDIPQPDELVFILSFAGSQVSGAAAAFTVAPGVSSTSARAIRSTPGWDTLAGGRTERWAAAGINAGGAFLTFFLGGCGARSPGPGAGAVVPCGCGSGRCG
jgi:hypothetical protein